MFDNVSDIVSDKDSDKMSNNVSKQVCGKSLSEQMLETACSCPSSSRRLRIWLLQGSHDPPEEEKLPSPHHIHTHTHTHPPPLHGTAAPVKQYTVHMLSVLMNVCMCVFISELQ